MPEPNTPPDSGAGTPPAGGAGDPPKPPEPPKKLDLTQEDLDRIIAERVARAVPKDYEDLKKLKEAQDAAADKEKTDLQKAQDAKAEAEKKLAERSSLADSKLKRAAILTEAAAQKATDTDIVVALLAGSDDIEVGEDGEVTGVKEAVKKLLKDKPVLVGKADGGGKSGGEFGGNDQATLAERITDLERQGKWAEARELKIEAFAATQKQ